jgi:hypothetical protein
MSDNPSLSLRQVAQAAGISPETARDVRNRLHRGEDPIPERHRRKRIGQSAGPARSAESRPSGGVTHGPAQDQAQTIERLKADPALRLTETGRSLLRLFQIHTIKEEEWEKISDNVPLHYGQIIAYLAKECSHKWTELAERAEQRAASLA